MAFSAIITTSGQATRNRFNRKVADFVILDNNFNTVAVVELDDSSHRNKGESDKERDDMFKEAGIKTVRYTSTPSIEQIQKDFI